MCNYSFHEGWTSEIGHLVTLLVKHKMQRKVLHNFFKNMSPHNGIIHGIYLTLVRETIVQNMLISLRKLGPFISKNIFILVVLLGKHKNKPEAEQKLLQKFLVSKGKEKIVSLTFAQKNLSAMFLFFVFVLFLFFT